MLRCRASADGGASAVEVPHVRKILPWCLFVSLVQERWQINMPTLPERMVTSEA